MLWSRPPPSPKKSANLKEKGGLMLMGSVGQELHHLERERAIVTDPNETRRRRTIKLLRPHPDVSSWGFTLQTYGIRNRLSGEVEVMTYVDYVELRGPAWIAGMRRGDVLLSVNGESVEGLNHAQLVTKIQQGKESLRLVVLFENCCHKVELYERFIKLKRLLSQKKRDLRQLEMEEKFICSGGQLNRLGFFRESLRSSTSSDWDRYSEIASPGVLDSVAPNQRAWRQHFFGRSTDTLNTGSQLSLEYPSPFSSRESLNATATVTTATPSKPVHSTPQHNNSTVDGVVDKVSVSSASSGEQPNGACSLDPGLNTSDLDPSGNPRGRGSSFYIEGDGDSASDQETPTLRRRTRDRSRTTESDPVCRKRSNSALLNDMRMKLLADAVTVQTLRDLEEGKGVGDGDSDGEACPEAAESCNPGDAENMHDVSVDSSDTTSYTAELASSAEYDPDTSCVSTEDSSALSDADITLVLDEDNGFGRLYRGVRINDSDEVTRL